ncbi:67d3a5d1-d3d3-43c1-b199-0f4fdc236528 [Sclerotinia trifoliorum]|uniref:67d3a5d1-d3d3-43c1-b199-0f4fdc236528 n=1 Tax=Sclerotinia trifoliorum TaxID=28548 RepID=A0A8H2VVG2_9HELO|nr:67d3a5d1-d3d3-43c1-b199-0f4fdc236528 [Sclerotinia trifoliorum]
MGLYRTSAIKLGELYYAFVPKLVEKRNRCHNACKKFNSAGDASRRKLVEMWKDIIDDKTPLPPAGATDEEEFRILGDEPYIDGPINVDYGINLRLGKGVYINFNCVFLDTCLITIGARTLIGPSCSFYAATHPLDPFLRDGTNGPELGAPITIGEDCWFGGSVTVCPGVTIGRGCTIGAGSVVTKDVPDFHVAAGNPARLIRKIEPKGPDPNSKS